MGVSTTPTQFARKVALLPTTLEKARVQVARSNARIGRANAEAQMRQDVNSRGVVTNAGKNVKSDTGFVVGKAGAKLSVKTRQGQSETFLVSAVGPWQLVNNRARPHIISPAGQSKIDLIGPLDPTRRKKLRTVSGRQTIVGRKGRATVLKTPYGYKRYVKHPGHSGKKTWQKALGKTKKDIAVTAPRFMVNEIARIF